MENFLFRSQLLNASSLNVIKLLATLAFYVCSIFIWSAKNRGRLRARLGKLQPSLDLFERHSCCQAQFNLCFSTTRFSVSLRRGRLCLRWLHCLPANRSRSQVRDISVTCLSFVHCLSCFLCFCHCRSLCFALGFSFDFCLCQQTGDSPPRGGVARRSGAGQGGIHPDIIYWPVGDCFT